MVSQKQIEDGDQGNLADKDIKRSDKIKDVTKVEKAIMPMVSKFTTKRRVKQSKCSKPLIRRNGFKILKPGQNQAPTKFF